MRLTRLEVKGFKSFANATTLHFGEADVIGVVGPNGSGKSNIVDAIRWVLGERKSGELRVDKMSSVIFNGTKSRRPSGVAQVQLTFDNDRGRLRTDFAEVTVGRLLYRDGNSEYQLNGVTCRRKDITDLFRDTGVAGDSYAIIALGMVDDILADRDNSRLKMIEQAAGVNTYKASKREAQQRLDRTRDDLSRVDDLLHEIDGNLRDLERQAKRARRYRQTRERYRELTLDYASVAGRELRDTLAATEEELARVEDDRRAKTAALAALEEEHERLREAATELDTALAEKRRRLGAVTAKLRQASSERQLAEQKIEYLQQGDERWTTREQRLSADRDQLSAAAADFAEQLASARTDAADAAAALAAATAELERARAADEARRADERERTRHLRSSEGALAEADRTLATTQAYLETTKREAAREVDRRAQDGTRLAELRAENSSAEEKLGGARAVLAKAEAELARYAAEVERVDGALEALRMERSGASEQLHAARREMELLAASLEQQAGAPESEQYLGEALEWAGKHPQLAEVLRVAPEHRAAVERALGPLLSCFIVRDFATASRGLEALYEAGLPTTIILVAARGPGGGLSLSAAPPGSRPLAELVDAERAYRGVVDDLLSETFACGEDLQTVPLLPGQTVVALDGSALRSGCSLSGKTAASSLGARTGRRERLAALRTEVGALEEGLAELDRQVAELTAEREAIDVQVARERVATATAVRNGAERALAKVSAQLEAAEESAHHRDERIAALESTAAQLEADARDRAAQREQAAAAHAERLAALTAEREAPDGVATLAEATAVANGAKLAHVRLENAVGALTREHAYAEERAREADAELAAGRERRQADVVEVQALRQRVRELTERIAEGESTRERADRELEAEERTALARRDELVDLERRAREVRRVLEGSSALAADLRERRGQVAARLEALRERLGGEFDLSLDEALEEDREADSSAEELAAELAKIRKRLEGFGEVNALAVEAYDAMNERHAGIAQQRDDILEAAESLEGTIAELDREATAKLRAAFEAVRGHFVDVFRHLFDEQDTADLVMLDPDQPLESKIEIVARPRGKRPQTIAQLSGGEKTLTATAFLFALYLIKPAPFCIFDEVDAPLDDANVEKFNRIIKRFSAESQFIVVTHNKLTMAAVDTIYGVYMPELGVSAVTPVDFRDFAHSDVAELVG